jgi:hypothetical protein
VRAAGLAGLLDLDQVARMNIVDITINGNFLGNERMLAMRHTSSITLDG